MEIGTSMPTVLIIDNDQERTTTLVRILKAGQYKVAAPLRLQRDLNKSSLALATRHRPDRC